MPVAKVKEARARLLDEVLPRELRGANQIRMTSQWSSSLSLSNLYWTGQFYSAAEMNGESNA